MFFYIFFTAHTSEEQRISLQLREKPENITNMLRSLNQVSILFEDSSWRSSVSRRKLKKLSSQMKKGYGSAGQIPPGRLFDGPYMKQIVSCNTVDPGVIGG
jgi:hypothetical protein